MEKVKNYILALAVVAMAILGGCTRVNNPSPEATDENERDNGITRYHGNYTVHVVPSDEVKGGKVAGLTQMLVTVSQNGREQTQEVDANGMAIFDEIYLGAATVYVSPKDGDNNWARVNFNETFARSAAYPNTDRDHDVYEGVTRIVRLPYMFGRMAIDILWDADKDPNTAPTPFANGTVRFKLRSDATNQNMHIQPDVILVKTDANGRALFNNVPAATGDLTADTTVVINGRAYPFTLTRLALLPKVGGALELGLDTLANANTKVWPNVTLNGRFIGGATRIRQAIDGTNPATGYPMKVKVVYYGNGSTSGIVKTVDGLTAANDGTFTTQLLYMDEADSIILYASFDSTTAVVNPAPGKPGYNEVRTYKVSRSGGPLAGRIGISIKGILKNSATSLTAKPAWLGQAAGKNYNEAVEIAVNSDAC